MALRKAVLGPCRPWHQRTELTGRQACRQPWAALLSAYLHIHARRFRGITGGESSSSYVDTIVWPFGAGAVELLPGSFL